MFHTGFVGRQFVGGGAIPPPPAAALDMNFLGGSLDSHLTLARTTVATYFDVAGVMQTAAINAARFDFDPITHAAKGLLVEEFRTNLLLNSGTLGTQSATVTAAPTTLSFYGNGSITLSGASTAGPLNGSSTANQRVSLTFTPAAGSLTLTVTGTVTNAQLETGAFATSYIPTAGVTVNRGIDVLTITPANMSSWFNSNTGTWMMSVNSFAAQGSLRRLANHGGAATVYPMWQTNGNNVSSTDGVVLGGNGVTTQNVPFKAASSWGTGVGGAICLNGGIVTTSLAMVTGFSSMLAGGMRFGADFNGANPNDMWISRITYWASVLTPGQLQAVSK